MKNRQSKIINDINQNDGLSIVRLNQSRYKKGDYLAKKDSKKSFTFDLAKGKASLEVVDLKKIVSSRKKQKSQRGGIVSRPREDLEIRRKPIIQSIVQEEIIKKPEALSFPRRIRHRLTSFLWLKPFFIFVIVSLLPILGVQGLASLEVNAKKIKSQVLEETNVAYQYFLSGGKSILESDFHLASYKFDIANQRFSAAQKEITNLGKMVADLLEILPIRSVIVSGDNLLEAGGKISQAGEYLSQSLAELSKAEDIFGEIKGKSDNNLSDKISFSTAFLKASVNLRLASNKLAQAEKNLERVDSNDFPPEYSKKILYIKETLPKAKKSLDYFLVHTDIFLEILGHNQPKKYILLFQNPRELRPTGGFVGTYAIFDMKEGKIENLKIEGPYAVDGQLKEKINAPEPLHLIQPRFFFHDANWFLDFPTSAKKMIILYEKSGGPTVDGIIAFNANLMVKLLKLTGPIDFPEYQTTINSDNFYEVTQRQVEVEYDKELNKPKKFIADLFPKLLDKLSHLDREKQIDLFNILIESLEKKDILIYFSNDKLENFVKDYNWAGEVKKTSKDYLAIVATNIGGGKTDHVMEYNVKHFSDIQPDGSVVDTLKIKKTHHGSKNDFWTSVKNMSFLRIYVPLGSQLVEAEGFDPEFYNVLIPPIEGSIDDPLIGKIEKEGYIHEPSKTRVTQEGDKTVFGNWSGVEVGQTKTITLRYQLPFKVNIGLGKEADYYSLFIQKQPGMSPYDFESTLHFPSNLNSVWKYSSDNDLIVTGNQIKYKTKLDNDKSLAAVFVKEEEE